MADRNATVSRKFVPEKASLIHGNELLGFDSGPKYHVPQHTVERVLAVLGDTGLRLPIGWHPPRGIVRAVEVFVSYLMLDAWIGNTDRHNENWGLVAVIKPGAPVALHLAPTFDHASSLGVREPDRKKENRLQGRDTRFTV